MNKQTRLLIFGEVLFDCFPSGEQILGGAPFNVAWHLQALGDCPLFISRVGKDERGAGILEAMRGWGMETGGVQVDAAHPTGRVEVTIVKNEPSYDIVADSAYDFIAADELPDPGHCSGGILYHGTLALRHPTARLALDELRKRNNLKVFIDVNLRPPRWQRDMVLDLLKNAHWAKMNQDELQQLAGTAADMHEQMAVLQAACGLEQLIVTRGEHGVLVRTDLGAVHVLQPEKVERLVDTVGAGDAFSAVYLHGLLAGWPVAETVNLAQSFAGKVIGLRGATTADPVFYQEVKKLFASVRC
ncbi:MAG: carbohydrate kinase [Desulfobulbus sp.]